MPELLKRVEKKHLERTYELSGWNTAEEFVEKLARKSGRLLKGAEPDMEGVSRQVIKDFNRGKIPWFVPPPEDNDEHKGVDKKARYKRKRAEREKKQIEAADNDGESSIEAEGKVDQKKEDRDQQEVALPDYKRSKTE